MRFLTDSFNVKLSNSLKPLIAYIVQDSELDLQVRDNYINVYYKGGNILLIKPNSFYLDEFYFYTQCNLKRKSHVLKDAKNGVITAQNTIKDLQKQRDALVSLLNENKISEYFTKAKIVMDQWEESLKDIVTHEEKHEQQQIAMTNRKDSDFIILDLEYAVSRNSTFNYNGSLDKKVPRFDIIAIHNSQVYVIELKKGLGATGGVSGIEPHIDCFNNTIGRDNQGLFIKEMKILLRQKQDMKLLDKTLKIENDTPKFIFAFADEEGKNEFDEFVKLCRKSNFYDEIIYLDNTHKLILRK